MSVRSMLAGLFVDPWTALLRPGTPGDERIHPAVLSALLWLLTLGTLFLLGWLLFVLADVTGRPLERHEAVVVSRSWRPASATVTVVPVIGSNGQVGTALVPGHEPERTTVCLRLGEQVPCARVRPGRFEALRPGTRVTVLARRGRLSGTLRITELPEDDGVPAVGR